MFLSAVWTLILTAPIHCRECFGEQIMSCKVMPISYLLNVTVKGVAHRTRSAVSHRAVSLKFEHIVFYVCTHTGGVIQHLSAEPSNDSGHCSNSCRTTERHLHCFIFISYLSQTHYNTLHNTLLIHYTKIPLLQNTVHISFTAWIKCKHVE